MKLAVADYFALGVLSLIGGWLGAFLNGYLGRKGENLATHEDIAKLVEQQKATALVTEGIRADMNGRLWVAQERWKQKVDLYVTALTLLDNFARRWERLVRGQSQASAMPSYEDDIQRIMVTLRNESPEQFLSRKDEVAASIGGS